MMRMVVMIGIDGGLRLDTRISKLRGNYSPVAFVISVGFQGLP